MLGAIGGCWELVFGASDNFKEMGDFEDGAFEMSGASKVEDSEGSWEFNGVVSGALDEGREQLSAN